MKKKLPKLYPFKTANNISNILVIGCGGTGAYTIAFLSRILSTMEVCPKLIIADGDVVELKNLKRQHFIESDIGLNKAEVLADRYSKAFGINITALTKELKTREDFVENIKSDYYSDNIIIGCVDNIATRKSIYKSFFTPDYYLDRGLFWVDSGNEEVNGQVVLGYIRRGHKHYNMFKSDIKQSMFNLPTVLDIYPDMLEQDSNFNSDLSCAERAISSPQNMMTNITAATLVCNYVQKILFKEEIKSHAVEFSINNTFTTRYNMEENLTFKLLTDEQLEKKKEVIADATAQV